MARPLREELFLRLPLGKTHRIFSITKNISFVSLPLDSTALKKRSHTGTCPLGMTEGGDEHSRPLKLVKGIQKKKSDQNNENANYECGSTCFKDRSSSVIHFLHFYIFFCV